MQILSNERLAKNRVRLGTGFHLGAMAVLALGVLVTTRQDLMLQYPWAEFATLIFGFGLFLIGQSQIRRWGPHARQSEALERAIKGLDDRYRLYAFLASNLPDYLLLGPGGIQVIEARPDAGKISCIKDKWKRSGSSRFTALFDSPFGNPADDARRDVQRVRVFVEKEGEGDLPISSLIVFTDPKVTLRIEGSSIPVTKPSQLRETLRRWSGKGPSVALSTQRIREVQTLFDRRMQTARTWR